MKKIITTCFFIFINLGLFANKQNIDQINYLKNQLANSKSNIDKIINLNKLSINYNETNLDSSIFYAQKALLLAKKINNKSLIADSFYTLGTTYKSIGKLDSAGYYLFGALDIYKDPNKKIITTIAIGEYYRANAELEQAIFFLNKAINDAKKTKNFKNLPHAFNRLGAVYYERSVDNSIIDGFFKDTLDKTIAFIDSSFYWSEKLKIDDYKVSNYNILGACYHKLENYTKAMYYLNLALATAESDNQLIEIPMIYRNISLNYLKTNQLELAKKMALIGAAKADSLQLNSSLAFNYYALVLIGEAMNDDKLSLEYLNKKDSVQYLVNSEIAITKAKELETKYKTKEKELLIEQQNAKLEKTQKRYNYIIIGGVFSLLIILTGVFFILRIRKINKLLELKNTEIEKSSIELKKISRFKNDLMGMIAHDLKNPLNTIINFSQMGNYEKKNDASEQKKHIKNIESAALNMLTIVNNIIDLQNFEEAKINLKLSENSIHSLLEESLKNVSLLCAQKNIKINNTVGSIMTLKCDRELMERVLINLFTNAIKFSPNNETISIEKEIEDDFVKIKITDKGSGIAPDKIPLLFNKYSRAEIRNSGFSTSSGLGLAFSKLVVNAHGGEIGVVSEIGNGASFWFTLKVVKNTSQSTIEKVVVLGNNFNYSNLFLEEIIPLKQELKSYQFYETGEILAVIKNYTSENEEFEYWKNEIENAILYSNKIKYLELIAI